MDTPITRAEYEEHNKRMEDEHRRMNHRLSNAEEEIRVCLKMATSIEKLANNMETMSGEQKRQGDQIGELKDHIDKIEKEPAESYNRMKAKFWDTGVGLVAGAFFVGLITMVAQYL